MLLVDARRLTGPNFFGRNPLVIVEIGFEEGETLELVGALNQLVSDPRRAEALGAASHTVSPETASL